MHHQVVTFSKGEGIKSEGFYTNRSDAEQAAEYNFPNAERRAVLDVELFGGMDTQYRMLYQDGIDYKWTEWSGRMPSEISFKDAIKIEVHASKSGVSHG